MSEFINNREMRKKVIAHIIRQLHDGRPLDEVKEQFREAFDGVSATEISEAEGALIAEGVPVQEVQRLCDVHAAVFGESIEEIHKPMDPTLIPGHPLNVMFLENRKIEDIIQEKILPVLSHPDTEEEIKQLLEGLNQLAEIGIHYRRKENLFFPYMEKYGITAPPKVMWGVDDEIRSMLKAVMEGFSSFTGDLVPLLKQTEEMLIKVQEMIFKEEKIMTPMLLEKLTEEDWQIIAQESPELGYIIEYVPSFGNVSMDSPVPDMNRSGDGNISVDVEAGGKIRLASGEFSVEELTCMLNALPFDITFVDKNDKVAYFSEGKERTFPRTRAIIGRNVSNCHPPSSVHVVEKIVEDFKAGRKDQEDFWIRMGEKYVLIRYYAVRSEQGEYLGVLEVTQDIQPLQELSGEKRLVTE